MDDYEQEAAMESFIEEHLRLLSEEPVFYYLSRYGDAIEARVNHCLEQAKSMISAGFSGAGFVRAIIGIEITIRFFIVRPLVQGAFLSDDWAELLIERVIRGRSKVDRDLLPIILRNWNIKIENVKLPDGSQVWNRILHLWPLRDNYVHKGDDASSENANLAVKCLEALRSQIVDPLSQRLGFTREETGCWSIVNHPPELREFNPPRKYHREDPFK